MPTFLYGFRLSQPFLYDRSEKPLDNIPVYFEGDEQCRVSMTTTGDFELSLSEHLVTGLKNDIYFVDPQWVDINSVSPDNGESVHMVQVFSFHILPVPEYE